MSSGEGSAFADKDKDKVIILFKEHDTLCEEIVALDAMPTTRHPAARATPRGGLPSASHPWHLSLVTPPTARQIAIATTAETEGSAAAARSHAVSVSRVNQCVHAVRRYREWEEVHLREAGLPLARRRLEYTTLKYRTMRIMLIEGITTAGELAALDRNTVVHRIPGLAKAAWRDVQEYLSNNP